MFPTIIRALIPKKIKIVTTNWIYDKTPYVQLLILSKPWKFYTILDGVDGAIFQVWLNYAVLHCTTQHFTTLQSNGLKCT